MQLCPATEQAQLSIRDEKVLMALILTQDSH